MYLKGATHPTLGHDSLASLHMGTSNTAVSLPLDSSHKVACSKDARAKRRNGDRFGRSLTLGWTA